MSVLQQAAPELPYLINLLSQGSSIVLAVVIVLLIFGWLVPKSAVDGMKVQHEQLVGVLTKDRDDWKAIAVTNTDALYDLTQKVGGGETPERRPGRKSRDGAL